MPELPWIYLDNNATTQTDLRVLETMLPYFTTSFANPGSAHLNGLTVNEAVQEAYREVAQLINARPAEILFTSGATEAVNMVLQGFAESSKKHIVTVASEHKAVLETCNYLETLGFSISVLVPEADGLLNLNLLRDAITDNTCLVAVMLANNETGVLLPGAQMSQIAHEKGALFLCDATQAVGKIPVDVKALGIDFMAFSAHKFYGPKGIGALYISRSAMQKPKPLVYGGGQQRSLRSGTLNVPGIIGFAKACTLAANEMASDQLRITALRDNLESRLLQIATAFVNGNVADRLYNTSNICFPGIDSERLILALGKISVSNGSACSAVSTEPSHVLKAIGLSDANALASIRFSLGRFNTASEIDIVIEKVTHLVNEFRKN